MESKRALRRAKIESIKKKIEKEFLSAEINTPRKVGLHSNSPRVCSCGVCGSRRKYGKGEGKLTLQEKRKRPSKKDIDSEIAYYQHHRYCECEECEPKNYIEEVDPSFNCFKQYNNDI